MEWSTSPGARLTAHLATRADTRSSNMPASKNATCFSVLLAIALCCSMSGAHARVVWYNSDDDWLEKLPVKTHGDYSVPHSCPST